MKRVEIAQTPPQISGQIQRARAKSVLTIGLGAIASSCSIGTSSTIYYHSGR